jgi:hypothetical protein
LKLKMDHDHFDELQAHLTLEIVASIDRELKRVKLPRAKRQALATSLAFHVCTAIDGALEMKVGKQPLRPVLTFAVGKRQLELISSGGESTMHEYVFGVADEFYGIKD